jgi:uncharacterized protein
LRPLKPSAKMEIGFLEKIADIPASEWNRLSNENDPFSQHAFLNALEQSHSVGRKSGWIPIHITLSEKGKLIGALPLYLKNNSYGEYIFDWGWAEAAEQAGIGYYPKLVSAIPFTPATGPRLLLATPCPDKAEQLWSGAKYITESTNSSSIHILFLPEEQLDLLPNDGILNRWTNQYHWTNPKVTTFKEWLAMFRSKERKKINAERKRANQSVDRIYHLSGSELKDQHIEAIWRFYQNTTARKWGQAYLTKAFFKELNRSLSDTSLVFLAERGGELVASSLCFQQGEHLYGRYWGCQEYNDSLHFELCYHRPIELCIERGWSRFEAGAQGEHKIKRGLMPTKIYSAHWFRHQGLANGISHFLEQERDGTLKRIEMLSKHGPFKREA